MRKQWTKKQIVYFWEKRHLKVNWPLSSRIYISITLGILLKLIFCEKGTKFLRNHHLRFVLCSNGQIYSRDFAKFRGLLRIYELYLPDSKEGVACATFEFVLFKGLKLMSSSASSSSSASERWKSSSELLSLVKVSKFQNDLWMSSYLSKNQQTFLQDFCPSL